MLRRISRSLTLAALVCIAPVLGAQATQTEAKPSARHAAKPAAAKPAAAKPTAPAHTMAATPKPAAAATPSAEATVDINRASVAELEAVPGIGKAYSAKIVADRPYANKLQLVQKKVLPQGVYAKVKNRLVAKQ